jgi:hypothetical protein
MSREDKLTERLENPEREKSCCVAVFPLYVEAIKGKSPYDYDKYIDIPGIFCPVCNAEYEVTYEYVKQFVLSKVTS